MPKGKGNVIAQNRKASHDYTIVEAIEAGVVLKGTELKSIRNSRINLKDGFVRIRNGEAYLFNVHISPYEQGNIFNHKEIRNRRLLLHKREIIKLSQKLKLEGLTLVPTMVYLNEGLCKLEIALCKGKKLYDKRESEKEKDASKRLEKMVQY